MQLSLALPAVPFAARAQLARMAHLERAAALTIGEHAPRSWGWYAAPWIRSRAVATRPVRQVQAPIAPLPDLALWQIAAGEGTVH